MRPLTIQEVVSATGGRYCGEERLLLSTISKVVADSRMVSPGTLFVPIIGERVDAHDFIPAAFQAGAACIFSQRTLDCDKPYILVDSTLMALQRLAAWYKGQFSPRVIGITGSVGKTTMKEMLFSALSQEFCVFKSQGNLNSQVGLPLTLFELGPEHQLAILEMGTSSFGEIDRLARLGQPDDCLFINIGNVHLEFLGSRQGVFQAKTEMLSHMRPGGHVFVNGDDDLLLGLKRSREDVITFGLEKHNDVRATQIRSLGLSGMAFTAVWDGGTCEITVPVPGDHMVYPALGALAVSLAYGMAPDAIRTGIAEYRPIWGRMNIQDLGEIMLINDAYNASPSSMRAALDVLGYHTGRKVAILGDMYELGEDTERYHREVGAYAREKGIDLILCVGGLTQGMAQTAKGRHYEGKAELWAQLPGLLQPGDAVLIKGSRGLEMEEIVQKLQNLYGWHETQTH